MTMLLIIVVSLVAGAGLGIAGLLLWLHYYTEGWIGMGHRP
jgi:hypothetical protein